MSEKLNILYLASWYPNQENPQNGNFIQQHAQATSKYCNVACLHTVSRVQDEVFILEENDNNGIFEIVVYYKKITRNTPLLSAKQKLSRQQQAYKLGYEKIINHLNKIDLVHLNVIFPAGIFALYLKKKYNLRFIITEHWTGFLKIGPVAIDKIEKYYIKKIAAQAEMICPVSENLKNSMIEFGIKNNYKVVPNVVNTAVFDFKDSPHKNISINILHLSNLKDDHKNVSGILHVIKKLGELRTDFKITIAGNGDIQKYKEMATALNIPNKIILFEGERTINEVANLMSNNDLFLLFSNYENLPCVISEAHVMGIPVLSSDVGGIAEMITHENGILTTAGNENELLDKLNQMLDSIENYDNAAIAKKAASRYSYQTVGLAYYTIYQAIIN